MTGPEVTAAMKAEGVDAGLVEKAARAAYEIDERSIGTLDLHPWSDVIEGHKEAWRVMARHALAAVLPEIQAQALRDAADHWQTREWANVPRRADRVADRLGAAQHVCNWLRERAARLSAMTECDNCNSTTDTDPASGLRPSTIRRTHEPTP